MKRHQSGRWGMRQGRGINRIGAVLFCVLCLCMIWTKTARAEGEREEPDLHAQSAVLMDGRTGRVLWEKDGETARPMASTTKIMTCILALELGLDDDRTVQVSSAAAGQPEVRLGMRTGQRFYTRDLLYSLMLESHNDSAVALAEAAAGSTEAFAGLMNRKARELGCENTWFITPNGLDAAETLTDGTEKIHSASARDLAAILRYCVLESPKAEQFMEITRTADYRFQDADGKSVYQCTNHNALLTMMEGVLSGKTGFTGSAGYCYTAAVESEGRVYILALLGCGWPPHKTYKWSDVSRLLAYGKENYHYRDLYREIALEDMPVKNGTGEYEEKSGTAVGLFAGKLKPAEGMEPAEDAGPEKEAVFPMLVSQWDQIRIVKELPDFLEAPVKERQQVGAIRYYVNGEEAAWAPVYTAEAMEAFTFPWCLQFTASRFLLPSVQGGQAGRKGG